MTQMPGVHRSSIVIDGHCDTLMAVSAGRRRLTERGTDGEVDLPRLLDGGVTAQVFAVFVDPPLRCRATAVALSMIDSFFRAIDDANGLLVPATETAQIRDAKEAGLVAGLLSLEGAEPLDGDLSLLRMFYRLGVRAVGLTWNHRNQAADGVGESRTGGGLTEFGAGLVEEMNRLGMVIDVAHLAPRGVEQVIAISKAPIIASHANAKAICGHRRNLTDDQLRAIAAGGGLVAVTFYGGFLVDGGDGVPGTVEQVADHIDHLVAVVGAPHVGVGSDFDGLAGSPPPRGLEDVSCLPNLTAELMRRGYLQADIEAILGGNFMRVFQAVIG